MKTNFKMMALGLAIAGSAMFANAKQYCGEVITSDDGSKNATLTCASIGTNLYEFRLVSEEEVTGYNAAGSNLHMTLSSGNVQLSAMLTLADDNKTFSYTFSSETAPVIYARDFFVNYAEGEKKYVIPEDIEWGSCGTAVEDNEAPVMGTATVGTVTHNSATIAVTATDNVGVLLYHVTDVANAIDQRIAPADGNITLTGLASDTEYNLTITALDAAGNESANNATASFTTGELVYHDFPTGHLGDAEFGDENGRITLTIAKKSDTSVAFIINPNNENGFIDYVEVKVSGQNPVSFGEPGGDTSAASHELLVAGVTFPLTVEYIQWHTASMDNAGRWVINNLVVNENELYVEEEEPGSGTGLPHMQADNMRVIARDGLLHVTTDAPAAIRVYNLQGMCVAEAEAAELHTALPAGTYVVAANGQAVKVALR